MNRTESRRDPHEGSENEDLLAGANCCKCLQNNNLGDGIEHPPLALSKTPISVGSGAKSDARDAPNPIHDPDLARIVDCWPMLPEHIKAAIKALVQSAASR